MKTSFVESQKVMLLLETYLLKVELEKGPRRQRHANSDRVFRFLDRSLFEEQVEVEGIANDEAPVMLVLDEALGALAQLSSIYRPSSS